MRTLIATAVMVVVAVGGCAESPRECRGPERGRMEGYYVPSTAIVNSPYFAAAAHPDQVLPSSDGEYFIPRGEREATGVTALGESTYYSIYTYDAQAISIPRTGGYGYQYRWILQQGLAVPPQ